MITSNSKGAELRYTNANGGEGVAAYMNFRVDSSKNFMVEVHVADAELLSENIADASENIKTFLTDSCNEIISGAGLE